MSGLTAGIIIGGAGLLGSVFGGISANSAAKKQARAAASERRAIQARIDTIEKSRMAITNPYAASKDLSFMVKDLSGMAKDLSGMISNPYANLGVATQAAKFQAEQVDMSLASTLDSLRETGSSAGGATALAQAALQSKQGISANIEQQEAQNEKLRAQGRQQLQQIQMAEAARIQNIQMSEAGRVQAAQFSEAGKMQDVAAQGNVFMFNAAENRLNNQQNLAVGQATAAANQEAQANASRTQATLGMIGGITGALSAGAQMYMAGANASKVTPPPSDRKLKKNIQSIGISPSGLNIYSFEYKDKSFGDGVWQGVMSDEIPSEAVIKHSDGFDRVDYSLLDVEFKQI